MALTINTDRDYVIRKLFNVLHSCETIPQLNVAIEMVYCYRRLYGDNNNAYELLRIASNVKSRLC